MKCRYCKSNCHKCGRQPSGIQKYRCQKCLKYQQASYKSKALHLATNKRIRNLVKEGVGIRGIARLLKISSTTVIKRIRAMASNLKRPEIHSYHAIYEIDELWTYSKSKKNQQWITYIYDRISKKVIDFVVGRRSIDCLKPMISRALTFQPKFIATDGLMVYRSIIPSNLVYNWPLLFIEGISHSKGYRSFFEQSKNDRFGTKCYQLSGLRINSISESRCSL